MSIFNYGWTTTLISSVVMILLLSVLLKTKTSKKTHNIGLYSLFTYSIGAICNLSVFIFNSGRFPVFGYAQGQLLSMHPLSYYVPSGNLRLLGDQSVLYGASIGDVFVLLGFSLFVLCVALVVKEKVKEVSLNKEVIK